MENDTDFMGMALLFQKIKINNSIRKKTGKKIPLRGFTLRR